MIRWGKRVAFSELASCSPGDTLLQETTRIRPTQRRQDLFLSCEQKDTLNRAIPSPGPPSGRPPSPSGRGKLGKNRLPSPQRGEGLGGEGFPLLRLSLPI